MYYSGIFLDSSLIAKSAGLSDVHIDSGWRNWIYTLDSREASEVHGRLIHMFNRVSTDNNLSDPKGSLMSYLSNLESEFKNWLESPWELFDYVLGANCGGPCVTDQSWNWLIAHKKLWEFRQRPTNSVPKGIRTIPLVEVSMDAFISKHLVGVLDRYLEGVAQHPNDAEHLIRWVEAGCNHLDRALEASVERWLAPLRRLRNPLAIKSADLSVIKSLKYLDNFIETIPAEVFAILDSDIRNIRAKLESYRPVLRISSSAPTFREQNDAWHTIYTAAWGEVG